VNNFKRGTNALCEAERHLTARLDGGSLIGDMILTSSVL